MIGALTVELRANMDRFSADVEGGRMAVKGVGTQAIGTQSQLKKLSTDLNRVAVAAKGVGASAAGLQTMTASTAAAGQSAGMTTRRIAGMVTAVETAHGSMTELSAASADAQFGFAGLNRSLAAVAVSLQPLTMVSTKMGIVSGTARMAATGAAQLSAVFSMVSTTATFLAAGIMVVLSPLRGLVLIPPLIAGSFSLMFKVILAPFKILIWLVSTVTKGLWLLAKPFVTLAIVVFRVKLLFAGLKIQFKLLSAFMGLLPPKLRVLFVGLVAIGAAAKAGSVALALLTKVVIAAGVAANVAAIGWNIITLQWGKAMVAAGMLTLSITKATLAFARFTVAKTVAGLKSVAIAAGNVAGMIGGRMVTAVKRGATFLTLLVGAAAGWGVKLAADAEQAEIGFTTMMKSGTAARAVLQQLEQFAASTPFQLNDLRDGAKQLLNAQVPAGDLTDKLRMLGDIAAGTGKPIGDFVRIFSKIKSTGKVSLESLNQLAERGVPIYTALTKQLGTTREEMLSMISKGKVGFGDINAALTGMATGAGVFAGGMKAQSTSLSGLASTFRDNLSFAVREFGSEVASAFDFKSIMARGIELFQSLRSGIAAARPAFQAWAHGVQVAFSAVWEIAQVTFAGISGLLGVTSGNWMTTFLEMSAMATWAFKEWPNIMTLAFTNLQLNLVRAGSGFMHLFTGILPALFSWFGENWKTLFTTAADFNSAVFMNIAKNIRNIMRSIWDYIASGGTQRLKLAWVPLLDGFKSSIAEIPNLPARAISDLEKQLTADSTRLGNALGGSLNEELQANMQLLKDFKSLTPETLPDLGNFKIDKPDDQEGDDATKAAATRRTSFVVDDLSKGSAAALDAIYAAQSGGKDKQLDETKKQTKQLEKLPKEFVTALKSVNWGTAQVQGAVS